MTHHCISTLTTLKSFLLYLFIMTIFFPFLTQKFSVILTTLIIINTDYFISSSIDFFKFKNNTIETNNTKLNQHSATRKKVERPILTIDTSSALKAIPTTDKISNDNSPELNKRIEPKSVVIRKRHYSVSSHSDVTNFTPQLSPTSSISSFSSNWSADSRRSRVEEMINLFETGGHQPHRRYSMDSHTYEKPLYIRERKFEYHPTASEWKKRAHNHSFTIQLSESKSTPIKQRMNPIPKKSKSTWA